MNAATPDFLAPQRLYRQSKACARIIELGGWGKPFWTRNQLDERKT